MQSKPIILLALLFISKSLLASDCDLAQRYYEQGLDAGKNSQWQQAKSTLTQSVSLCNTFNNWYLLGQVYQVLNKNELALSAFEDSQRYAKTNNEKALAMGRYAEGLETLGEIARPLSMIHAARKMHVNAPSWMTDIAKRLDAKRIKQPLTTQHVQQALTNRAIKIFDQKAKPNLNVSINFKDNSVEVIKQSYGALDILAKALVNDSLQDKQVIIIGHSDERGTEDYNQTLSEKRAIHIRNELISRNPTLAKRLKTKGVGENFPLYSGKTELDYLYNRRIEIQVQ